MGSQANQAFPCYRALLVLSWLCLGHFLFSLFMASLFTSLQASAQNDSLSVSKRGIFLSSLTKIATHLLHSSFVSCFMLS